MAYSLDLAVANKMGSIVSCMLDLDLCIVVGVVGTVVGVVGVVVVVVVGVGIVDIVVDNFDNFDFDNWMVIDSKTD